MTLPWCISYPSLRFNTDDHCDIIPFLHCFYRARKITPSTRVYFVHIDAHADLSIPARGTIEEWEVKDDLYDILSEEGGIAEFIIPLFTMELIREVVWISPSWKINNSNYLQLPLGYHHYQIKDCLQERGLAPLPKVNWKVHYYLDDDSFAPFPAEDATSSFQQIRILHCTTNGPNIYYDAREGLLFPLDEMRSRHSTKQSPEESCNLSCGACEEEGNEWILDICLDYFSTNNPFIDEFNRMIECCELNFSFSGEELLTMVQLIYSSFPYRSSEESNDNPIRLKQRCKSLLHDLLFPTGDQSPIEPFLSLFGNEDPELIAAIQRFGNMCPFLTMQLKELIYDRGHLLLLPHNHVTEEVAINASLKEMRRYLFHQIIEQIPCCSKRKPPLCVTIATSSMDEYTLPDQCDLLLSKVLATVNEILAAIQDSSGVDAIDIDRKTPEAAFNGESSSFDIAEVGDRCNWREIDYPYLKIHDIRCEPIVSAYQIQFRNKQPLRPAVSHQVLEHDRKKTKQ